MQAWLLIKHWYKTFSNKLKWIFLQGWAQEFIIPIRPWNLIIQSTSFGPEEHFLWSINLRKLLCRVSD